MNIVITGFMGTGKTTVGRRVAERLKVPFFDVDDTIRRKVGSSVSELFAARGEAAFRLLESEAISELSAQENAVISTGGGALLDPKNREALQRNGLLVCLTARTSTLLERLKDDVTRPLLAGEDLPARIERLKRERDAVYALCRLQVATDDKTIEQVAEEVVQHVAPLRRTS
jgi:shikimate kinase